MTGAATISLVGGREPASSSLSIAVRAAALWRVYLPLAGEKLTNRNPRVAIKAAMPRLLGSHSSLGACFSPSFMSDRLILKWGQDREDNP